MSATPLDIYKPKALYYEDADSLEYVRVDVPSVYRRIDEFLTLILDLETREPIGFKIKGFKNFYLRTIRPNSRNAEAPFLRLITVVESLMTELGAGIFSETPRRDAYKTAADIASEDQVILSDLPKAA
ncbi:hypothetical protein FJW07_13495 [Mesorhizobium sp. B3-1-9]|uniref:hypothetical protein n=1 Tax=Mesorhizobium sp. B3-1-9 TaxID=2589892 RepID=UPI00112ADB92|nr:hypothetical protein [Mesorhizobium sp. B3-1-9]TPI39199.1 hypothetical protein FJW07_13495 [Mesorhizobium sp. B3-1-9]